jgi:hypothetical protein
MTRPVSGPPDGEHGEPLAGGGMTTVVRIGETVRRSRGPWSERVEALLSHLDNVGFTHAPSFLGISDEGDEILQYLKGDIGTYPLSEAARSSTAIATAGEMLHQLHEATAGVASSMAGGWMLADVSPAEVICHGDFAPYNCVFDGDRVVGIIDFDAAHPGPRLRDIAYAVYRFAPLTDPESEVGFGSLEEQAERARMFCDSYGLDDRSALVASVCARLRDLVEFMRAEAASGNAAFEAHLAAGHDLSYLRDVAYLERHAEAITEIVTSRGRLPGP